ncbi:CBO0543 family protein [Metabacillus herbersteinensis]|uniref:CBO0543 family protein n=1 Tax=Metabacillus herbersteinensis TaxID=283816 RepID=A0ABV6G9Y0_9BACI
MERYEKIPLFGNMVVDENAGLSHTHIALSIMAVKYPATIFIYLSKYPQGKRIKKILYTAAWVLLYAVNETIDLSFNLLKYYNGWNFWWSIMFSTVMFTLLRVHYKKPLAAWLLSIGFIVFLWNLFDVPSSVFR